MSDSLSNRPRDPARMTSEEAYVLHAYHQDKEKLAAGEGDYDKAKRHKERAAEIGRVFWPADRWERSWSNQR